MSRHKVKPVDISLPPEARGRKRRQGRIVAAPSAQMSHGSSPRGQAQRRRGEKWLDAEARLRADAAAGNSDTGDFTRYAAEDEAGQPRDNVVVITRQLGQEMHDEQLA